MIGSCGKKRLRVGNRKARRWLLLAAFGVAVRPAAWAQTSLPDAPHDGQWSADKAQPGAMGAQTASSAGTVSGTPSGTISGTVTDRDGALIAGARVELQTSDPSVRTTQSGSDGRFVLGSVPAGDFLLIVSAADETTVRRRGTVHAGEVLNLGSIALDPVGTRADVQVNATREELAEAELKVEETQRIGGFIPNFYVSYDWKAAPLSTRQKYRLAFRTTIDPVTFLLNGVSAGVEQAENTFPGYGQGAAGYGKRFAANYGDIVTGTLLGGAVFPQWMHQDPRYFYKGTGSIARRFFYALGTAVVCRGDNGKWQPCYSAVLGDLAAGAISNAYYPASDRHGAALTLEQGFLSVGLDGVGNVFQEFLIRHLTPHPPTYDANGNGH